jgi:hypothetical protein
MKKAFFTIFFVCSASISVLSQGKTEFIHIGWPEEYHWKVIQKNEDDEKLTSFIIPGKETPTTASILGSLTAYKGAKYSGLADIISNYRSRIDTGSMLTVVEKDSTGPNPWVIFKVETPANSKYPEPESDLYYVVQGKFALYENYVAVKKPSLGPDFVKEWVAVFKTAEVRIE